MAPKMAAPDATARDPEFCALATAAGPQREPFDCQVSCRLNVAATGKRHARSTRSGVRVTDEAMACGDTFVCLRRASQQHQ